MYKNCNSKVQTKKIIYDDLRWILQYFLRKLFKYWKEKNISNIFLIK